MYSFFLTLETVFSYIKYIPHFHLSFLIFFVFISPLSHFDRYETLFYNIVCFDFIANRIQFHYNIRHRKFSLNCKRSVKKGALRNFTKFTGKHLCQSLFFNKVADLIPSTLLKKRPETLLKKKLWHRCFLVNFAKFLGTPFLQNTSGRLLLKRFKARK